MKTTSIAGIKSLNEATKAYRDKPKEEQLKSVQELLKLYQAEIDQLNRRSKNSESAFYSLYKSLFDAPDPVLGFENMIEMVTCPKLYYFIHTFMLSCIAYYY
jgi:homeobox protein cut-like